MTRGAWLAVVLMGCGGPDTLHYALRDPTAVTVYVDGQLESAPTPHDELLRTGDDTLAQTSFQLEAIQAGVYGRWSTHLALLHGEVFELVGPDGWLAALPTSGPARAVGDDLAFDFVPRLDFRGGRHYAGYVSELASAAAARSGEHVVTLVTPRANFVRGELRGDRSRIVIGAVMGVLGIIYTAVGAGTIGVTASAHKPSGGALAAGSVFGAAGLALDAGAIYELVRGARHRTLHP